MENEHQTPLSMLPRWREKYGNAPFEAIADAAGDVSEMCRCMRRYPSLAGTPHLDRLLLSWFMPRNNDDLDCFVRRYHVWSKLPDMVAETMYKRKEK